jgi:hypothetical protein
VQPIKLRTHFSLTVPGFFFVATKFLLLTQLFDSLGTQLRHPAFVL